MRVFKYTTLKAALAILEHGTLKFSHPDQFNDVFECLPADLGGKYSVHRGYKHMQGWFLGDLGICCFSKLNPYSDEALLMWTHYAMEHRGVALEFDTDEFEAGIHKVPPVAARRAVRALVPGRFYPCQYTDRRARIPDADFHASKSKKAVPLRFVLRKANAWKYEKEVRVFSYAQNRACFDPVSFRNLTRAGRAYANGKSFEIGAAMYRYLQFPRQSLKRIYLGVRAPSQGSKEMDEILKQCRKRYKIEAEDVNIHRSRYGFGFEGPGWMGLQGI